MPRLTLLSSLIALLLIAAPSASPARAGDTGWDALLTRTAQTFARPGGLAAKRRLVGQLGSVGRPDAWVLMFAALEQEGHHLDALGANRRAAWAVTRDLWSLPRRQHHEAHARTLRESFARLGAADERWFQEKMLVGQIQARLRGAPAGPLAEFVKQATAPASLVHPVSRAAVANVLAAQLGQPAALQSLRTLLERDESSDVRLAALHALPTTGEAPVPLLMRRLRDDSWVVRVSASRLVGTRGLKGAAPLVRRALREAEPREALVHRATLRTLGEAAPEPASATLKTYGVPIPSRHVVFVLDCSAVMGTQLARARRELSQTIEALPAAATFAIVAYHGAVMPWRNTAVSATAENKRAARTWLAGLKAEWNASLGGALREAFRLARLAPHEAGETPLDTIVIVAASRPTGYAPGAAGPLAADYLPRLVRAWNTDGRVRIQAIALGDDESAEALGTLAHEHDGTLTRP